MDSKKLVLMKVWPMARVKDVTSATKSKIFSNSSLIFYGVDFPPSPLNLIHNFCLGGQIVKMF
jgi:hypothetical protein